MADKAREKRGEERVATALPVMIENFTGITRDVSATGMFFETEAAFSTGSAIRFVVEIDVDRRKRILRCQGTIVRVENRDSLLGVAVKILDATMEAV